MDDGIFIMRDFPDFNVPGFDIEAYNERFKKNNVIIHARSSNVSYGEHWGCLSIKCAFKGSEYYQSHGRFYAVNDNNYLVFNEGKTYSSYIFSDTPVESFTINFSSFFTQTVAYGLLANMNEALSNDQYCTPAHIEFTEKLYSHDDMVSPLLNRLYRLSVEVKPGNAGITELYYLLLEKLLLLQAGVNADIKKIKAARLSTKTELYKRLHYAKDFIDSCYTGNITLQQLSSVACLNSAYLLRQFKKHFSVTPYQYIIHKRLAEAKHRLETTSAPVTEICFTVGYGDVTSFAKLFKQYFQLTPEKYRLNYQKKSFFTC
ncbi:MAG TPA: AraC family transcriptional regulator [Chitinophagaceae bacterium]|nr:AraC family transcriptional regulator [Chitinophagaceae bacterium]